MKSDHDRGLAEPGREPTRDDPDHPLMPPRFAEDDDRKRSQPRVGQSFDRLHEERAIERLPLFGNGLDLDGERARLVQRGCEEQAKGEIGLREAARSVDARRVPIRHVLPGERVAGRFAAPPP